MATGSANGLVNMMNTIGKWRAGLTAIVAMFFVVMAMIVFIGGMFPRKHDSPGRKTRAKGDAWMALVVGLVCLAYGAFNYVVYKSDASWVRGYRALSVLTPTSQVF